jgi:hypothetical protein
VSNLLYLGAAVLISLVGSVVVVLRNHRPTSIESGVEDFARQRDALSPSAAADERRRRAG